MSNYYERQLSKISNTDYNKQIVIHDGEGNKTHYISLTVESIPIIINYLHVELVKQIKEGKTCQDNTK